MAKMTLSTLRTKPRNARPTNPHDFEATLTDIRRKAYLSLSPQELLRLIWDSGVDLDTLVDRFARTHRADGYRNPELQKKSLDAIADRLSGKLAEPEARELRDVLEHWYCRYMLAADIGFEMGFAAASRRAL